MKQLVSIVLLALLSLGMTGGWASARTAHSAYKTYTSSKQHFSFHYPTSWKVAYAEPQLALVPLQQKGHSAGVVIQGLIDAHNVLTLDLVVKASQRDLSKNGKVLGTSTLRVAGADARLITGQKKEGSSSRRIAEVLFLSHGTFWQIVYANDIAGYGASYGAFKTIYSSFSFTS